MGYRLNMEKMRQAYEAQCGMDSISTDDPHWSELYDMKYESLKAALMGKERYYNEAFYLNDVMVAYMHRFPQAGFPGIVGCLEVALGYEFVHDTGEVAPGVDWEPEESPNER